MTKTKQARIQRAVGVGIEARYSKYLLQERGLTPATVHTYWWYVRAFLQHCGVQRQSQLKRVQRLQIDAYVGTTAKRVSLRGVQVTTSALRSFLRFAFLSGLTPTDWSSAVLAARSWRHAQVPRFLPSASVERLLASPDRATPRGRQQRAVLLLMARLGLRPKEIQHLRLGDINWKRGELLVRGKGLQHDWLPLPHEVGEAVAAHLRDSRPRACRNVFVAAGSDGPMPYTTSWFVNDALRRAVTAAGLPAPARWIGASLLRHSLATTMLHRGASLHEIGGVLRHRWAQSTEIYAKVDIERLRGIARPWPMEVRS